MTSRARGRIYAQATGTSYQKISMFNSKPSSKVYKYQEYEEGKLCTGSGEVVNRTQYKKNKETEATDDTHGTKYLALGDSKLYVKYTPCVI